MWKKAYTSVGINRFNAVIKLPFPDINLALLESDYSDKFTVRRRYLI